MKVLLVALLAACAASPKVAPRSAPTMPPAEVKLGTEEMDPCEERRRYNDGVCDEFCPEVDPDCDPRVCLLTPRP